MEKLSKEEIDTLGEIANISMGNAATNLSLMVNHKVNITTPLVQFIKRSQALDDYEKTCIFIQIHYIKGLSGNNVFVLKENDALVLTDLMMGGTGENVQGEMGELQLSAMSEAMNQMMGASATSMATMLDMMVDIGTPEINTIDVESVKIFEKMFDEGNDSFVKITFKMDVEGLIDSTMVQLYPVHFAREMCDKFNYEAQK
ncbi:MAG: flagellar motor switch phosphatase FliY [Lachnospiraceae bacterium]|nr:flagellar motor switch phosphatase FliY [Lachnospiraceae bacterium]